MRRRRRSARPSANGTGATFRFPFGSMEELVAYASKAKTSEQSHRDDADTVRFSGATWNETVTMARHGWPEGAKRAKGLLEHLEMPLHENVHSGTYHDVTGSYVDVGEYVQGVPECMVEFKEDTRPARFARVLVSASYSGGFSTKQMINRGVAIAAAIDALESQGVRCDVEVIMPCGGYPDGLSVITLPVKQATDPMNLDTLIFAVAHPSYLRRLVFAVMECQDEAYRLRFSVGGSYGHVKSIPNEPGALIFNSPTYGEPWDEAYAKAQALAALETYKKSLKA